MKRYRKIETAKEQLTDSDIDKLQPSFASMMEKMKAVTPVKPKKTYRYWITGGLTASVLAASVATWYLLIPLFHKQPPESSTSNQLAKEYTINKINPPHPGTIIYEHYVVKKGKSSLFTSKKGTRISVPPQAFVFPDGKPCLGDVDIRYREFHNAKEIFLSGIPMHFDSANKNYTFETAGMFDIRAFNNGIGLKLADGKAIRVDLASNAVGLYNIYYFDTIHNQWKYINKEEEKNIVQLNGNRKQRGVKKIPDNGANLVADFKIEKTEVLADNSPEKVLRKRNKKNFAFKIDFDQKTFPELAGIKNLLFEVTDTAVQKKYLRGTWDSVSLVRSSGNSYVISIYRLRKNYTFSAHPVLNSADYDRVIEKYRNNIELSKQQTKNIQNSVVNQRVQAEVFGNIVYNMAYSRNMTIYNLGYWNCDRPIPVPVNAVAKKCRFKDEKGKSLKPENIYIVQKKVNVLWTYPPDQQWNYSNSKENFMWFILSDGRYAIVNDDKIRNSARVIVPEIVSYEKAMEVIDGYM